jgi:hypothetical protein
MITCADNSTMGAWDMESGRKVFFIVDAHDGEEITCVTLDRPCRKIATGARNGIIKVLIYYGIVFYSCIFFVSQDLE